MPNQPETSSTARILIVEEEVALAKDLALSLKNLGLEVAGRVSSAAGAVRMVEESEPDLILMDIDLDGDTHVIEAAEQIRSQFDIPVVCLTGFDDPKALERAKQTTPYGYLRKTANSLEMRCTIETALCRHESEKRIRVSEERVQLALKGGNLGLWDWDLVTGDVFFNERSAEMLGYLLDEIKPLTRKWTEFIHPEDKAWVMEEVKDHLEGRTPFYESEHRRRHKSGKWVWIRSRGQVVARDKDGKPLRATGTHLDITERKKAEEALTKARDELERSEERRVGKECRSRWSPYH